MKLNKLQFRKYIKEEFNRLLRETYKSELKEKLNEATSLSTKSYIPGTPDVYRPMPHRDLESYIPSEDFLNLYDDVIQKDVSTEALPSFQKSTSSPSPGPIPSEKDTEETEAEQFAKEDSADIADIEDVKDVEEIEDEQFAKEDSTGIDIETPKIAKGMAPDTGSEKQKTKWVQVASTDRVIVRNPKKAYSTKAMADYLSGLSDVSGGNWYVGDLSKKGGGRLAGHASHQSGIDADISLPTVDGGMSIKEKGSGKWGFKRIGTKQLDLDRTLGFLVYAAPRARYVFIDKSFHKPLKRRAREMVNQGTMKQEIYDKLFGKGRIVKHEPHHKNHFHVRLNVAGVRDPHGRGKIRVASR